MVLNRQKDVSLNLATVRAFVRRLRRLLRLGRRDFNVCFVGDREIRKLNVAYRGKPRPTDVLSFPWDGAGSGRQQRFGGRSLFTREPEGLAYRVERKGFLGDVLISVETARRNARAEGRSTAAEVRWLILHGLLHLVGYDHETDAGEMTALELSLRGRLGIDGRPVKDDHGGLGRGFAPRKSRGKEQKSKGKN